jgi:hypothetical protein
VTEFLVIGFNFIGRRGWELTFHLGDSKVMLSGFISFIDTDPGEKYQ